MNLEDIVLNEVSQSQKHQYCMIPLIWGSQSSQIHRGRKPERWLPGLGEGENREVQFNEHRVSVKDDGSIVEVDSDETAQQCECTYATELHT